MLVARAAMTTSPIQPGTRLGELLTRQQRLRNTRALLRYLGAVVTIVAAYTALFQVIMRTVEGQVHSWITGLYWTLSTMTTLGVGDVVFQSDVGRLFTTAVLMSGILLFLVVLPFAFIRYFYAPWSETRRVPGRLSGHVIIASSENLALPLVAKLQLHDIPYYVIEPDPTRASLMQADGISVAGGEIDDRATYEHLHAAAASLVVANATDTTNTNIALTVREAAPEAPIVALAEDGASVHILRVAGATHVLPLKQRLGEHLANRLNAGHAQTHVIGAFRDLLIAEFPVHHTPFVGKTIREIALRDSMGLNVIGVLDQARFVPADPETPLTEHSVPVVVGSRPQIEKLDEFLIIYDANYSPVIVVGGGKVGCAATHMLQRKGLTVHLIDRQPLGSDWIGAPPDQVFVGDAAERDVVIRAGLAEAPGVLLTTSDDAMNIYLAVHCRQLAPNARIVSRVTHDRNVASIQRAGADIALSHTSLGVETIFATLRGHELVILGEGVELHELAVPPALVGRTLAEAGIAAQTGLNVIAIQEPSRLLTNPAAPTRLQPDSSLLMIGDQSQLRAFSKKWGT
jgi:voltage-gated potassium channel